MTRHLIAAVLVIALTVASHLGAYAAGRGSLDKQRLQDALAYASEITEIQAQVDTLSASLEAKRAQQSTKNRTITREVIRYVDTPADRRCTLDPAWRLLHDAAATGQPADTARVAAGAAEPVTDAAVLETVAGNYENCRDHIAQLDGWRRWWNQVKP